MISIDKDLNDVYELLNEYRIFNSIAAVNNVVEMLDELIIKFNVSKLDEYRKAYKLLKKWRNEIINSFNRINGHVISNGRIEQ